MKAKWASIGFFLSTSLLALSVLVNGLLVWQLKIFSRRLERAESANVLPRVGAALHPISATDLLNRRKVIDYSGVPHGTILYIFSPSCSWCRRNERSVRSLREQVRAKYRFVGISLSKDGLDEYVRDHKLDFPVYVNLAAESIDEYHLGATPQTLVISPEGRLLANWTGAYGTTSQKQISDFFSIVMPQLAASD